MSTSTRHWGAVVQPVAAVRPRRKIRWQRVALHVFLIAMALVWLFPIAWVAFTAFRPIGDTIVNGYVSFPQTLTLDNFISAWNDAELPHFFLNTLIIVVPALILILWISSMLGFVFSRFSFKLNIAAADHVHGREPPAAADHHRPAPAAVPDHPASRRRSVTTACSTTSTSGSP